MNKIMNKISILFKIFAKLGIKQRLYSFDIHKFDVYISVGNA